MYDNDPLIDPRTLLILVLAALVGVAIGMAQGVGAGIVAGLGAAVVLHTLVARLR